MGFLSPLALAWLGSIPALVWLWRYATSRRQIRVSSLVPFEHLLRRAPTHRTRVLVNWLFWLQLACLALAALALAEPVLFGRRTHTRLVIIDTSASMQAALGGPSAFQRAKQELLNRIARKDSHERMMLVASAPVTPLTMEPTSDAVQLRQVVEGLSPSDVGGNLALAGRIGRSLIAHEPDTLLILTDEAPPVHPAPSATNGGLLDDVSRRFNGANLPGSIGVRPAGGGVHSDPAVEVRSVSQALPNAAIVGADVSDPLCWPLETAGSSSAGGEATTHVLVTVQNFSDEAQTIRVTARLPGAPAITKTQVFTPNQRQAIPLEIPAASEGLATIQIEAPRDALALDNQFIVSVGARGRIPVVVSSERAEIVQVVGRWLEACPRITWSILDPASLPTVLSDAILITDDTAQAAQWPKPSLIMARRTVASGVTLAHWLVDTTHPITSYLEPLEPVITSLDLPSSSMSGITGDPVLWAVSHDRKIPLVLASETGGRRRVIWLLDPTATPNSVPITFVFLNSLRWLAGSRGLTVTGEPLTFGDVEPGSIRIERPDGAVALRDHPGGVVRYEAVDRAGRYRLAQPGGAVERTVNFVNPVESDTMHRLSTWSEQPSAGRAEGDDASTRRVGTTRYPLVHGLLRLILLLLIVEWWGYSRRNRPQTSDLRLQTTRNR